MNSLLIIDDEKDNLEALKRLLKNEFDITTTTSAIEALKFLQTKEFNVIISDQRMPDITGVELLEKAKIVQPNATRVLLTGYTDIEAVINAINKGNVYRYIAKPWDPEELKTIIRQANEACFLKKELEKKNSELSARAEELRKALDELKVLDRSKARFLSLISHELNTPLTVLISFVGLLVEKKNELPPWISTAVVSMEKATNRFNEIVREVLDFVKLESDTKLSLQKINLKNIVIDVINSLSNERLNKKISFKVFSIENPEIYCDNSKINLAIFYFIKDSIDRALEQSEIKIDISRINDKTTLSLIRQGEKIQPEAFLPFEPSTEILHHSKNLGLGLAICKLIIERHRGEISIEDLGNEGFSLKIVVPNINS